MDVAQLLSASRLTCPAVAQVREPAALERAEEYVKELEKCAGADLDAELEWAKAVRAEAAQPCDWRSAFQAGAPMPGCTMLTRSRRRPCDPPTARCSGSGPRSGERRRGLVEAPLYILINRRTGSAAEQFAAVLRDNGAATLVGERTAGAGCGYIDGGHEVRLKHSGVKVKMPNCVRSRLDGTNEVEGIAPDVTVPWSGEDLVQFDSYAEKILAGADTLTRPPASGTSRRGN